jgi:hypothetical protein
MPHLAHVPAWLWERANAAIDARRVRRDMKRGEQNSLHGIPRDSRGPLSGILVCGVCGAKMLSSTQVYLCARARRRVDVEHGIAPRCSNRFSPSVPRVHSVIAHAIADALRASEDCIAALTTEVRRLVMESPPETQRQLKELRAQEANLQRACEQLASAVEQGGEIGSLIERLRTREAERHEVRVTIAELEARSSASAPLPTEADVRKLLDTVIEQLLGKFGREVAPHLRRLIDGKIRAVRVKEFDTGKVKLRAILTLNLVGLLPAQWSQLLADRLKAEDLAAVVSPYRIPLAVDLYPVPSRFRHAKAAYELVHEGRTIAAMGLALGLPETSANRAYHVGKAMAERGLSDPYVLVDPDGDPPSPTAGDPKSSTDGAT